MGSWGSSRVTETITSYPVCGTALPYGWLTSCCPLTLSDWSHMSLAAVARGWPLSPSAMEHHYTQLLSFQQVAFLPCFPGKSWESWVLGKTESWLRSPDRPYWRSVQAHLAVQKLVSGSFQALRTVFFCPLCLGCMLHLAQVCELKTKGKRPGREQSGRRHIKIKSGWTGPPPLVLAEEQTDLFPQPTKIQLFIAVSCWFEAILSQWVSTSEPGCAGAWKHSSPTSPLCLELSLDLCQGRAADTGWSVLLEGEWGNVWRQRPATRRAGGRVVVRMVMCGPCLNHCFEPISGGSD